jgi:F0F1-type ATP synthase delta subunit
VNKKPEFRLFLANPTVTRQAKVDTIEKIFNGPKSSKVVLNLFTTLAGNARLDEASNVTNAFVELMKVRK